MTARASSVRLSAGDGLRHAGHLEKMHTSTPIASALRAPASSPVFHAPACVVAAADVPELRCRTDADCFAALAPDRLVVVLDFIDPHACRDLWQAVLAEMWQAVFYPPRSLSETPRQEAYRWFGGRDCALVCSYAGFDFDAVMRRFAVECAARGITCARDAARHAPAVGDPGPRKPPRTQRRGK